MRLLPLAFLSLCLIPPAVAQDAVPAGKIAQITIVHRGSANIRNEAIRATMTEKVGDTYSPAAADKDAKAIKDMADFNGEVRGIATADPAGGVDLTFTVAENPLIQKIVFTANTPDGQPSVPTATLLGQMDTKVGQVLNTTTLARDLDKLFNRRTGFLHTQGYIADVGADISVDPVTGTLTIPVTEAHIAQILVTGNHATKADDIFIQFGSKLGDVYNEKMLMRDLTRVYNMGAFDQVGPYQIEPSGQGQLKITVPVIEKKQASAPVTEAAQATASHDPALTPRLGEVRLEGTVRETFSGQSRLILWASRATDCGRPSQAIEPARQKIILVHPSTQMHPATGAAALASFQPGDTVIVVGKSLGPGKPLLARLVAAY